MGMLASPKRKEYSDNGPHTIPAFRRTRERSARDPMPYAISNSAFGNVLVASNPKGVASILIGDEPAALIEELQDNFPGATLRAAIAWSPHRTRGCLVPAAHTARAVRRCLNHFWNAVRICRIRRQDSECAAGRKSL